MHSELLVITQKSMNVNMEWTPKVNYIEKPSNRITTKKKTQESQNSSRISSKQSESFRCYSKKITTTAKYWQVDKKTTFLGSL